MTTFEVSNLGRYGFMGGRGGASLSGQMGHRHQHRGVPASGEDASMGLADSGSTDRHNHQHGLCAGCGSGFLMNLLGLDRFTKGLVSNCKDFWTIGKELGVEYEQLYDVPVEGFREAKRRRQQEEDEEGHAIGGPARKGARKGLLMGFGLGRSGSSRGGYEPVSQV
ncbi:hypothetical protein NEOLEDRAFT_763733 [Neolentinus lepideus HHB14362 ss-1]|uniref:Uncharacterized protein n=1 Tax=Neolentinus lepideus HHB14362 ss-1 TaxID=1314782 RepID=A0A165PPL2_9AGAM|nr:hypothetical protein NEOLEDRAFT_763733 [Neolentinus lepideus HHB14362 ss-1]